MQASSAESIAVVGMGCRFPGRVQTLSELWQLAASGRQTAGPVPADRWDAAALAALHDPELAAPAARGCFLAGDVWAWEPEAFAVAPAEREWVDPQSRVMLEVAWEAVEHAGIPMHRMRGSRTGVYLGTYAPDNLFRDARPIEDAPNPAYLFGNYTASTAGRVAFAMDLRGPVMVVSTHCSSSLVALDTACGELTLGECAMAVAGGVLLMLAPQTQYFEAPMLLSHHGACHAVDARADGYVRAEGAGALVLKRLGDARRGGDRVLAVIWGSAVNNDGQATRLTAPSTTSPGPVVVTGFDEIRLHAPTAHARLACVELHQADDLACTASGQLATADGTVVAEIRRLRLANITPPEQRYADRLAHLAWAPEPPPQLPQSSEQQWLALAPEDTRWGQRLSRLLGKHAAGSRLLTHPPDAPLDTQRLAESLNEDTEPARTHLLLALNGGDDADDAPAGSLDAVHRTLAVLQHLAGRPAPPRLWVLRRGDHPLAAAGVRGLLRAAAFEHPELRPSSVEVCGTTPLEAVLADLLTDTPTGDTSASPVRDAVLAADSTAERRQLLQAFVITHVRETLGNTTRHIGPHTSLIILGLGSLGAVQLQQRLHNARHTEINPGVIRTKPSPASLADWLLEQLGVCPGGSEGS
ncbi:beta-ketoacyl synthase N-terminal-like domain-containing protein [Streptomyces syringium]|uniref:beta-ketoacyl synthase N-terminal-like domain-containing protein n=1 Tax=Streptomyces syringium TaxID=76729 RepID=UPI0034546A40